MELQQTVEALTAVLKNETAAARDMEAVLTRKRSAFVRWHTGDLAAVVAEEEGIIASLNRLEKERVAHVRTLSRRYGKMLSMKEVLAYYPSDELFEAYDDLRTVSARVIRWNNQNRDLVQSSLTFVRRTLGAITGNFRYKLLDQKV
ncbi:MAG: flagellar protein FlgN [Bacteroidetes bacterium]|nr:flagellar protein FlgN [Bacteroidota bacterium]